MPLESFRPLVDLWNFAKFNTFNSDSIIISGNVNFFNDLSLTLYIFDLPKLVPEPSCPIFFTKLWGGIKLVSLL